MRAGEGRDASPQSKGAPDLQNDEESPESAKGRKSRVRRIRIPDELVDWINQQVELRAFPSFNAAVVAALRRFAPDVQPPPRSLGADVVAPPRTEFARIREEMNRLTEVGRSAADPEERARIVEEYRKLEQAMEALLESSPNFGPTYLEMLADEQKLYSGRLSAREIGARARRRAILRLSREGP